MQKINYREKILIDDKINELLLINIDDKLEQTRESDCIKISGEIKVSGEVNTDNGKKLFNHPIEVDILLSSDQIVDEKITVSIEDFNYSIEDNAILIDLIMKIDGLKEIEPYFPAQEDQTIMEIENHEEVERIYEVEDNQSPCQENINDTIINEEQPEIEEETEQCLDNRNDEKIEQTLDTLEEVQIIDKDDEDIKENLETNKEKFSLLNQVFKNRQIKKETCYLFHVVKEEKTYQDIANLYNINIDEIKKINNDEEIYKGKLVLIPKM